MNAKDLLLKNIFNLRLYNKSLNFQREVIEKVRNNTKNFMTTKCSGSNLSTIVSKYGNVSLQSPLMVSMALTLPVVKAWGGRASAKDDHQKVMEETDRLFEENSFDKMYEILRSQPSWYDDSDVLWRVARCEYHMSKRQSLDSKESAQLLEEALRHVVKALELCEECGPAHKWAAILLNAVSTLKGTREKVEQVLNVRIHMEKAVKYSPNDPTAHYLLGEWHYHCYHVSWIERKFAGMIYGSLPEANLEVGLQALEKAEEIDKDFYSKNKVLIAKTLVALNRDLERAKSMMIAVVGKYKNSDKWDDKEAVKEAKETLNKLGVKITEINTQNS